MGLNNMKIPYVDFSYYKGRYFGGTIKSEIAFKKIERISEAFVNRITFGRIYRMPTDSEEVKDAICYIADIIFLHESEKENPVKSESNDGYSINYGEALKDQEFRKEMYSAAKSYLSNTTLLNRGWVKQYDYKC